MSQPTSEKLADALAQVPGIPPAMVDRAREGFYDDYRSPLAMPQTKLIADLTQAKQQPECPKISRALINALIRDVRQGEFDGTSEEAAAWAASPEGIATFNEMFGQI
jgi:hypothetical protein